MALDLASIQGWQIDRRRALALLRDQHRTAQRRLDDRRAWALSIAIHDVLDVLRARAASEIEEGVYMHYVHVRDPLHKVAA